MSSASRLGIVFGGLALLGAGFAAGLLGSRVLHRAPAAEETAVYYCPMHPSYTSDKPGECPICHMKLVRRAAGESHAHAEGAEAESAPMPVAGRTVVALTPERRQILGVHSEPARVGNLEHVIRTLGRVAVDERRLHHVHTKYDGYVEHLYVDFTGKFVKAAEPLLALYSPDLVATQQEYLLAHRAQAQLSQGGIPQVAEGGENLLQAARERLLFWDIRPADIERLGRTGQVMRTLDLYSAISGYVVKKTAFHGMRVTPQDTLFDIADLSRVWVLADVYEYDLPSVRLGMHGEIAVPFLPARRWKGPVTYIDPTVDEKTRTIKVRIEVENRGAELKPDMFADVFLRSDRGTGLVVPENAVINAGDRRLVFVDRGEGRYEPREVTLGIKVGDAFQILSGLEEGDRVVTSANFLIDSESSLKAALATMGAAGQHRH